MHYGMPQFMGQGKSLAITRHVLIEEYANRQTRHTQCQAIYSNCLEIR